MSQARWPNRIRSPVSLALALVSLAVMARLASPWYLKWDYRSPVATLLAVLVPPKDLYASVARADVAYGHEQILEIRHRYAGAYAVLLQASDAEGSKQGLDGHLRCHKVDMQFAAKGILHRGAGEDYYILGYYSVDRNMVDQSMTCSFLITGSARESRATVEIIKSHDW